MDNIAAAIMFRFWDHFNKYPLGKLSMQGIPGNNRFLSTANVASAVCDDNILKLLLDTGLLNHAKSANEWHVL